MLSIWQGSCSLPLSVIPSKMRQAAIILIVLFIVGCSKTTPLPGISDTTQKAQTQTTGDAVNRVASDKELLRQTLVLADSKGTLEAALTEAAQDSIVGIRMREALVLGSEAKQKVTAPPPKGPVHHAGGGEAKAGEQPKANNNSGGKQP